MKTISNVIFGRDSGTVKNRRLITDTGLFDKGLLLFGNKTTHAAKATNALINIAMVGTYPHFNISYPNIVISNGPLPRAQNAKVIGEPSGNLLFTWEDNSGFKSAKADDRVIIITYFPVIKKMIYTLHQATRSSCRAVLQAASMKGCAAETWIGFVSNDEREAGDSVYAGRVNL